MFHTYPMKRSFHLTVSTFHSAFANRIIFTVNFFYLTCSIFLTSRTPHYISILQTYFLTWNHTEELFRSILHEILTFDPKFTREGYAMRSVGFVLRIIDSFHFFRKSFRIVGNNKFNRIEHGRHTQGASIKILTGSCFKKRIIVKSIKLCIPYHVYKLANGLRRISTATQAAYCRHTRVIPTFYKFFLYQSQQFTLTHNRISQIQTIKLILARTVVFKILPFLQFIYKVIVKRTMRHKFKRTDRMGHPLKIVALSMSKIVHRISLPLCTSPMMLLINNSINDRITEMHIRVCHIDFCTKHHGPFRDLTAVHLFKKRKTLFYRTVAIRAGNTGLRRSTLLLCNLLTGLLIYISMSLFYQSNGKIP